MKTELDGLKQLEEVRQQFELERDRHRKELDRQTALIEKLKQELVAEKEATYRGADVSPGSPGKSGESVERVCVRDGSTAAASSSGGVGTASPKKTAGGKTTYESHPKKVTFIEPECERGKLW